MHKAFVLVLLFTVSTQGHFSPKAAQLRFGGKMETLG